MRHYKKVGIYVFKKLDELLDEFLGIGIPGNDCTVYYKGNCVYRRFAGFSDKENKIPMNGKELYNIYSCSKVIKLPALRHYNCMKRVCSVWKITCRTICRNLKQCM